MALGEQIKQAREAKNLSQEDLAEQLGVSRQAISKWENDSSIPHGANRDRLSQFLDLELSKPEPPIQQQASGWFGRLGWIMACLFLILFLCSIATHSQTTTPADIEQNRSPVIQSITFYDSDQNAVSSEALWYDAARIESILIQWDGGTPGDIKMFAIPSGTETTEETELLLTKMVTDGDSAELLNADTLKKGFQNHIFFQLDFGGTIVVSDQYNVFFDETLTSTSDWWSESFQDSLQ